MTAPIAERLVLAGTMPPGWERAFVTVRRADFVPTRVWPFRNGSFERAIDRDRDPDAWLAAVEDDIPLVTQWDDGAHTRDEPGELATSSASAPTVVALELATLDLADGMRVLEIGTGTGWTAALLAARGADVTTVEVDPDLAAQARAAIDRTGYATNVTVVTGDGALGHIPHAPYDRVHVTAGVRNIPAAWIEQAAPGAVLVMPWGTDYNPHDQVVHLTVTGNQAGGPFRGGLSFMKLRSQRAEFPDVDWPATWKRTARASTPALAIADVAGATHRAAEFVTGLMVPDCMPDIWDDRRLYLYGWDDSGEPSLAEAVFPEDGPPVVHQAGPRNLWTEVEAAHAWWTAAGQPEADRFGLTVAVDRNGRVEQRPWYETPARELPIRPSSPSRKRRGTPLG
ncbi:methyltransferase domain-containing protein [Embleya sp. NPDC050154]|uniref:methyltransferase domain-containing protein n=1 Tax=unclassified Embleya TaxID=2699296 RepID=UPI0037B24136